MINAEWLSALDAHDGSDGVYLSIDTNKIGGCTHPILSDGDIIVSIGGSRFNRAFGAKNKLDALSRRDRTCTLSCFCGRNVKSSRRTQTRRVRLILKFPIFI